MMRAGAAITWPIAATNCRPLLLLLLLLLLLSA